MRPALPFVNPGQLAALEDVPGGGRALCEVAAVVEHPGCGELRVLARIQARIEVRLREGLLGFTHQINQKQKIHADSLSCTID